MALPAGVSDAGSACTAAGSDDHDDAVQSVMSVLSLTRQDAALLLARANNDVHAAITLHLMHDSGGDAGPRRADAAGAASPPSRSRPAAKRPRPRDTRDAAGRASAAQSPERKVKRKKRAPGSGSSIVDFFGAKREPSAARAGAALPPAAAPGAAVAMSPARRRVARSSSAHDGHASGGPRGSDEKPALATLPGAIAAAPGRVAVAV